MREALARSDHDFVISESRSRGNARRRPAGASGFLMTLLRFAYRAAAYPNRVAAALLITILIAIVVNALMLQRSPHPAPLFGKSLAIAPPPAPAPSHLASPAPAAPEKHEAAALPSAEPEPVKPVHDPITQLLKGNVAAPVPPAPPAAPHRHSARQALAAEPKSESKPERKPVEPKPAPNRDGISQLLKSNGPASAANASPEPSKTILDVQRALVKLGFVLKPDGINGAATRQALEQFERDNHLPSKGELTARVRHELATQSGMAIE